MKNTFLKRTLAVFLTLVLCLGTVPVGAAADTAASIEISRFDCTEIGTYNEDSAVYYYDGSAVTGAASVVFTDYEEDEISMIAGVGSNTWVIGENEAPLSNGYKKTKEDLQTEAWEFTDPQTLENLGNNLYVYWVTTEYYDEFYVIVNAPEEAPALTAPTFTASVSGVQIDEDNIKVVQDAYEYTLYEQDAQGNWNPVQRTMDLYVLTVPLGTAAVDFIFSEECLAYGYDDDRYTCTEGMDEYSGGFVGKTTATRSVDKDGDGLMDFVTVQSPYDSSYNSVSFYAITFAPFYATAGGDWYASRRTGVAYTDPWSGTTVPVLQVALPDGVNEVKLQFPENVVAYNYAGPGEWLAGSYDDDTLHAGLREITVKKDADQNGIPDYIQVQSPFDSKWNSTLLYAISFVDSSSSGPSAPVDADPEALMTNIAAGYVEQSDKWAAVDMSAYAAYDPDGASKLSAAARQAYITDAIAAVKAANAKDSDCAVAIIALTAVGADAQELYTLDGVEPISAVTVLSALEHSDDAWRAPYTLLAYAQGDYAGKNKPVNALLTRVLAAQNENGSWTSWGESVQATANMLCGLASYRKNNAAVSAAMDKAVAFLSKSQTADGGFNAYGSGSDANTTATVITGLAAAGVDSAADARFVKNGVSAMDNLLSFAVAGNTGFGYTSNSAVNAGATQQGFRALIAQAQLEKAGKAFNVYDFSANKVAPAEATWAQNCPVTFQVIPSGAAVTVKLADAAQTPVVSGRYDLAAGTYAYTAAKSGYITASGSLTVSADEAAGHLPKKLSISLTSAPAAEAEDISVSIKVMSHSANDCEGKYTYKSNASHYSPVVPETSVALKKGQTVFDALSKVLTDQNISFTEKTFGYIGEIGGDAEFGHGSPKSGWQYMVNGSLPTVGCRDYALRGNETIIWFFTDDYTKEKGSEQWADPGAAGPDGAENEIVPPVEETVVEVKPTASVTDGEATVSVTAGQISAAIGEASGDENAAAIVIAPVVNGDVDKVTVELPGSAVSDVADTGELAVTVTSKVADVSIPNKGLTDLAKESGSTVTISAEKAEGGAVKVEVAVDGKPVEEIAGGLTVAIPIEEKDDGSVLVIVREDGTEEIVKKSFVNGELAAGIVDGSCTVKVKDNTKTFTDTKGHWGKDAIDFAGSHELFSGVGKQKFAPDSKMTRGMLATVLYRLEDAAASGSSDFADVPDGKYYTQAVVWASGADIVSGYGNGKFGADDAITREQLAAMLYRYAQSIGMDTRARGDMSKFTDNKKTSKYANEAMRWAVANGIVTGKGNGVLDPKGRATRAEVAAMLQRLIKRMVKTNTGK